ncbi:GspH/FimT family pseudopilin [uncultured Methylobacterium sp.]|uniref:GspH/FimT family pseudopilin n=1 Tax=uncultured Methylobacterium sp. TaxID=157278 RepID=UPI0035CBFED0
MIWDRMGDANAVGCPGRAGFTLIEVTLMLAIVSLTAVLALPRSSVSGGSASLRIKAFEIVAVLRADRDEAVRSGRPVTSLVDLVAGQVRSATNGAVSIPASLFLRVSGPALDGIRFMPDGSASGGEIFLMRADRSGILSVRVNPLTAAIGIDRGAHLDE